MPQHNPTSIPTLKISYTCPETKEEIKLALPCDCCLVSVEALEPNRYRVTLNIECPFCGNDHEYLIP